ITAVQVCRLPLFFSQAEDGIRDDLVTGVQTCALPISRIALALDLCSKRTVDSQDELLDAFGLPDKPPHADPKRVLAAMALDKKARRGKVAWVMPRRIGHAEIGHSVPAPVVRRVVARARA